MQRATRFASFDEVQRTLARVRSAEVPIVLASSFPCPVRVGDGFALRVLFAAPPDEALLRGPWQPELVCEMDGETARLLRLARCLSDEFGALPPLPSPPDAPPALPRAAREAHVERMRALAPTVWQAFAHGDDPTTCGDAAREFLARFDALTRPVMARLCHAAAPEFMRWLRAFTESR